MIVYRIQDRGTGEFKATYSRCYNDQFDFSSPEEARESNIWGIYRDRDKFKISKYKVTYELVEDDVDI